MYEQQDEQFFQYAYWETNRKQQLRHLETLLTYKTAHEEPIEDVIKAIQVLQALQRGFWGQLLLRMSRREFSPEFGIKHSFIPKIINLAISSLFFLLTTGTLVYGSFVVGFALGQNPDPITEFSQSLGGSIDKAKN